MINERHAIIVFSVNQGESRICENHEMFTLNKYFHLKKKQCILFIKLYRHMHINFYHRCTMSAANRASVGTRFGQLADHSNTSATYRTKNDKNHTCGYLTKLK